MKLTAHGIRCLGALAALIEQHERKTLFFSRWDIGRIVYGHIQGIHLKTMVRLFEAGLVRPEVEQAVDLVATGTCTCGCDRWTLREQGWDELRRNNVKVPTLPKAPRRSGTPVGGIGGFGLLDDDDRDAADWWKKDGGKDE
jgi:hypothetical protein